MKPIEKKIMFRYYISLTFIVFFAFVLIGKLLYIQIKKVNITENYLKIIQLKILF